MVSFILLAFSTASGTAGAACNKINQRKCNAGNHCVYKDNANKGCDLLSGNTSCHCSVAGTGSACNKMNLKRKCEASERCVANDNEQADCSSTNDYECHCSAAAAAGAAAGGAAGAAAGGAAAAAECTPYAGAPTGLAQSSILQSILKVGETKKLVCDQGYSNFGELFGKGSQLKCETAGKPPKLTNECRGAVEVCKCTDKLEELKGMAKKQCPGKLLMCTTACKADTFKEYCELATAVPRSGTSAKPKATKVNDAVTEPKAVIGAGPGTPESLANNEKDAGPEPKGTTPVGSNTGTAPVASNPGKTPPDSDLRSMSHRISLQALLIALSF